MLFRFLKLSVIGSLFVVTLGTPFHTQRERDGRGTFYFNNPAYSTCVGEDGREGYCLFQGCFVNDLRYKGRCGFGLGSCCLAEQSCLRTSNVNNTYFVNPGFPHATTSLGSCEMIIKRRTADICQIRLDFLDLDLEQPDRSGNCYNDVFTIAGTKSRVPELCGSNKGQHMYFDVDPLDIDAHVTLSVTIKDLTLLPRSWNIKVTQIGCASQEKAPSGCLQYYTGKDGIVNSFNFVKDEEESKGARQLADTAYSICVRQESDSCGISWASNKLAGRYAFTMSGNLNTIGKDAVGTPAASLKSCEDSDDFVLIPNGVDEQGQLSERLCGLGFPSSVTTYMTPFILHTRTSSSVGENSLKRGFSLRYQQRSC